MVEDQKNQYLFPYADNAVFYPKKIPSKRVKYGRFLSTLSW